MLHLMMFLLSCQGQSENAQTQPTAQNKPAAQPTQHKPPHRPGHSGHQGGQHHHGGQPHHPPMNRPKKPTVQTDYQWVGTASADPKSIVIISLDTVRADRLSVYGGRAKVENLQQLADQGTRFSAAISHFPETALSHWSMLSGVMPEVHGNVPGNGTSIYKGPSLAQIAKQHGYATGAFIGGVTLQDSACGLSRGFDVYDDQFTFSQEDMSRNGLEVSNNALQWISQQKGPYFAFLHYFDAHFPYTPSAPWDTRYDPDYKGTIDGSDAKLRPYRDGEKQIAQRDVDHVLALYDGEISELDGKISSVLKALGDDVIVVVTSDHGESFEHGYYFNHRAGLWDSITRVPLLIRGPNVPKNKEITTQVGLIDLLPTVLDLAGLRKDKRFQGESMVALFDDKGKGRQQVYSITDPWMPNPQFAVRSEQWKWIAQPNKNLVYQIDKDPDESNLLSQVPEPLKTAKTDYGKDIDALRSEQVKVDSPRHISAEECQRLKALGYMTCDGGGKK